MKTKEIVNISLFTTLLAVCAWICIPTVVPFTMQTFAVFLAMLVLGGKKGTIVILIYLFLGMAGVPVFSRGTAGIGVLFGYTGGYMVGWIFLGLVVWLTDSMTGKQTGDKKRLQIIGLICGLVICYITGTLWFRQIYAATTGNIGVTAVFSMCVAPFIIPDLIKMTMAFFVSKRIKKYISNV